MDESRDTLSTLAEIEAVELVPDGDLDELVGALKRRQDLLDRLQKSDVQALPDAARRDANVRIRKLHDATVHALTAMHERMKALQAERGQVVTARRAVRGYRPDMQGKSGNVNRRA